MKIALLKLSGKTLNDFISSDKWISSVKELLKVFEGLVIVHGAGKDISEWSQKMGLETKFVEGQRVTTREQMDIVAAVQAGVLNTKLTAKIISSGINAAGFSGIDRGTFTAKYLNKDLGFVGKPVLTGSTAWINNLLAEGIIPVFSSVCTDAAGNLLNVNADVFAETLALALNADTVFFASDVEGVKLNGSIMPTLNEEQIINGIVKGEITDGMVPKLNSCIELLKQGINKIWIGANISNNNLPGKNNDGNGTWIVNTGEAEYELLKTA